MKLIKGHSLLTPDALSGNEVSGRSGSFFSFLTTATPETHASSSNSCFVKEFQTVSTSSYIPM